MGGNKVSKHLSQNEHCRLPLVTAVVIILIVVGRTGWGNSATMTRAWRSGAESSSSSLSRSVKLVHLFIDKPYLGLVTKVLWAFRYFLLV